MPRETEKDGIFVRESESEEEEEEEEEKKEQRDEERRCTGSSSPAALLLRCLFLSFSYIYTRCLPSLLSFSLRFASVILGLSLPQPTFASFSLFLARSLPLLRSFVLYPPLFFL